MPRMIGRREGCQYFSVESCQWVKIGFGLLWIEDQLPNGLVAVAQRESGIGFFPDKGSGFRTVGGLVGGRGLRAGSRGANADVPIGYGTVIALQTERAGGFLQLEAAMCRTVHFDIFVDGFTVVNDLHEFRIGGFLAGIIEAGCLKNNIEGLPLAERFGGIDDWRMAVLIAVGNPLRIDATTFDSGILVLGDAEAIINLHFILPHHINAGIGFSRDHEFDMDFAIAIHCGRDEIGRLAFGSIDSDAAHAVVFLQKPVFSSIE